MGIALALGIGTSFAAGTQEVARVALALQLAKLVGSSFGDQPVAREVTDAQATLLTNNWRSTRLAVIVSTNKNPGSAVPRVIQVPSDFPTIQAALDNASTQVVDTILVSPGVYTESLVFKGKRVQLQCKRGLETIVRPNGSETVTFDDSETSDTVISGFTLTNSNPAIYVRFATPTITSNLIINCGEGITVYFASPAIRRNRIIGGSGAGIALAERLNQLSRATSSKRICNGITMNAAGSPLICNNVIQGNRNDGMILGNGSDATIIQNVVVGNGASGISIAVGGIAPRVVNNTVVNNVGNGIYTTSPSLIANNIVMGTKPILADTEGALIQHNNAYSSNGAGYTGVISDLTGVDGNISTVPLFRGFLTGDFHLVAGSPGLDIGTNNAPGLPAADFDGRPRIVDGDSDGVAVVDMGAFEYDPSSVAAPNLLVCPADLTVTAPPEQGSAVAVFAPVAAPGLWCVFPTIGLDFRAGNECGDMHGVDWLLHGKLRFPRNSESQRSALRVRRQFRTLPHPIEWATAATNIQDAIEAAVFGDRIVVTNGVYQFGSGLAADGTTNRVAANKPLLIVSVNGAAAAVIDGDGTMRCVYLTNGSLLNGFTLTNGTAMNGGGAYCTSTNVQLFNCQVSSNSAVYGGGVYSGTLSNCNLSGNIFMLPGRGGGSYNAALLGCDDNNNTGGGFGGGVSDSVAINCTLAGNAGAGSGARVAVRSIPHSTIAAL